MRTCYEFYALKEITSSDELIIFFISKIVVLIFALNPRALLSDHIPSKKVFFFSFHRFVVNIMWSVSNKRNPSTKNIFGTFMSGRKIS